MESRSRAAAVAGMFYPADPESCRQAVERLLAEAAGQTVVRPALLAAIAPHAGHVYSGAIAAQIYPRLLPVPGQTRPLAILGPNHRLPLAGIALDDHGAFRTPLGSVEVATDIAADLAELPATVVDRRVHRLEHCIEVHLPFLQVLGFAGPLVPIVVGDCAAQAVAALIARLVEQHRALVLVSSDLSHFLDYRAAQCVDAATSTAIAQLATDIRPQQACGCRAINGLNTYARQRGWRARALEVKNSGDTAGDRARVVGYGAYAYTEH